MTLKNYLYNIEEKGTTESGFNYCIKLIPDCEIYSSHFPHNPITPGMCILQIIQELLEDATGKKLTLISIKNTKFLSILKPEGQSIFVVLSNIKEENEVISTQTIVSAKDGTNYAKVSMSFALI